MIPTLFPTYGRDYKRKADIASDLNNNKDFYISGLSPALINKEQLVNEGIKTVVVRYGNQRKVTSLKLVKGEFKWLNTILGSYANNGNTKTHKNLTN